MSGVNIFISYAREDGTVAARLYRELKSHSDFSPWLDVEDIAPGTEWPQAVLNAIRECRFFIALLSSKSVAKTGFVQREMREAIEQLLRRPPESVFIIPVRLEACEPRYDALRAVQWVDLFPNWSEGVKRIVEVLRLNIEATIAEVLDGLRACRVFFSQQKLRWIDDNAEFLAQVGAVKIIERLDKCEWCNVLSNELCALDCLIHMAVKYQLDSLYSYVFRASEIAKKINSYFEWPNAFGVVLNATRFLEPSVRTLLLRDTIDYLSSSRQMLVGEPDWYRDLIFAEIAKHYSVRITSLHSGDSPHQVTAEASCLLGWDIAFLELWTFHLQNTGEYRSLLMLVPVLRRGLMKHGKIRPADFPVPSKRVGLTWSEEEDLRKSFGFLDEGRRIQPLFADHRVNFGRLGLLFRIGEHLTQAEERDVVEYGRGLSKIALDQIRLTAPNISRRIEELDDAARRNFVLSLEYQRETEIWSLFPAAADRKQVIGMITEACYYYDWESDGVRRVPIDPEQGGA